MFFASLHISDLATFLRRRAPLIALILILIISLSFNIYLVIPKTPANGTSGKATSSPPRANTVTSTPTSLPSTTANVPITATAVHQMLSQLCTNIRTGDYRLAYTQLTTAGYKRSNPSPEALSFKSLGGITECVPPLSQNIVLASPYITHCYLRLRRADSGQQFNHKFDLTNTEGGVWKIYQDDSTTETEDTLLPQCGNFPS